MSNYIDKKRSALIHISPTVKIKYKNDMETNKPTKQRDLRRVIACKFPNGLVYLTEPVFKILYRVVTEGDTIELYFDTKLNLSVNPEIIEWVDVEGLIESRNGIFYDPTEYLVGSSYGCWMKSASMITFVANKQ